MFKIESYVTPILLSYVDKYVRDFKPANAQVSLWGGGVALHNLVLKPDVLQQEVSLPFTLVSGRIHELLIQVPWTKIISEPIVVTIDTIECVLNLKPPESPNENSQPPTPSRKTQVVEAPPGYMQALVRRIVSNIALKVHHLIVKYVQDDIVLSLNVKHLSIDSAGVNWEPAFADIDQANPTVRRLVRLDDLTLCLDKADADGKIRFYQEPLLYRCHLDLRVLTQLVSANCRRASSLSVHLRSSRLAFSVTSDQLTLLLRLMKERILLDPPKPPTSTKLNTSTMPAAQQPVPAKSTSTDSQRSTNSWSEWAWSWLPTWTDKEGGLEDIPVSPAPLPIHFDAFLDDLSLVFKVMELVDGFNRKRSRSVIEVGATHAVIKSSMCAPTSMSVRFGARDLVLRSHGKCVCGVSNYDASIDKATKYLKRINFEETKEPWTWPAEISAEPSVTVCSVDKAQNVSDEHRLHPDEEASELTDSLSTEHNEESRKATEETDALFAKMRPLIYVEFLHERSPPSPNMNPYDNPPKDFQYSDWVERRHIKVKLEPLEIGLCMGLVHRFLVVRSIFKEMETTATELPMRVLTVEECDSLMDNLPERRITIEGRGLRVRLHPWNHYFTSKPIKSPVVLGLELPNTSVTITGPLYPHRVCSAACQLPDYSGPLWQGARVHVNLVAKDAQLLLTTVDETPQRPCARVDAHLVMHILLNQSYFKKKEPVCLSYLMKIRELNVSGSWARLQAVWYALESLIKDELSLPLKCSSLAQDALHDEEAVVLDFTLEEFIGRGYYTRNVKTFIISLQSARATAFHEPTPGAVKQAWIFSAPDAPLTTPYLRMAIQWCDVTGPEYFDYLGFWAEATAVSIDPLFIAWLAYKPVIKSVDLNTSSMTTVGRGSVQYIAKRKLSWSSGLGGRSLHKGGSSAELVHIRPRASADSSSEPSEKKQTKPAPAQVQDWWQGERILALHQRLRNLLIHVEMGLIQMYVTTTTASAVDCVTLRDAMERHAVASHTVLAISLGRLAMHSNAANKHLWQNLRHDGPTFLSEPPDLESFPWKIRLADVSCYTLEARTDRDSSGSMLRSKLKAQIGYAQPRTVLELVTTTITVSVVIKTLQIKNIELIPEHKVEVPATTASEKAQKTKYFTSGVQFKPTTLQEFFRGPKRRGMKPENAVPESKMEHVDSQKEAFQKVTVIPGPVVSLGVHLHADTPPINVKLQREQIQVVSAAIHCFRHIYMLVNRDIYNEAKEPQVIPVRQTGSYKSFLPRSVSEQEPTQTISEDSPSKSSDLIEIYDRSQEGRKKPLTTFLMCQWVVSHASVVVASATVKLAFDMDDIISTVDLQHQYNQLKIKVTSAAIRHYELNDNDEWLPGVIGGRVLEAREQTGTRDEDQFLAVTITQAHISRLPEKWKQELHPKLLEHKDGDDIMWEIYATLAPLEALIQPLILENVVSLLQQMMPRAYCPMTDETQKRVSSIRWPFCYLSAGGVRVLVTAAVVDDTEDDDTFVFTIDRVSMNPHPDNPIGRRVVQAGDTGWTGAAANYDGRQYELIVKNIQLRSARFKQLMKEETGEVDKKNNIENPAVKWNQSIEEPSLTPLVYSLDVCLVLAPAMFTKDVLTCGPALELNILTDCVIEMGIDQLLLWQKLLAEMNEGIAEREMEIGMFIKQKGTSICPYADLLKATDTSKLEASDSGTLTTSPNESDVVVDSGVETNTSQSTSKSKTWFADEMPYKKNVFISVSDSKAQLMDNLEVFMTMGTLDLALYVKNDDSPAVMSLRPSSVADKLPSQKQMVPPTPARTSPSNVETDNKNVPLQSVKTSTDDQRSNKEVIFGKLLGTSAKRSKSFIPLVHAALQQPNLYYWRSKDSKNLQVSLFDARADLGMHSSEKIFNTILISTAKGTPDPATDIHPALATLKIVAPTTSSQYTSSVKGSVRLDVERPIQVEVCSERIKRLVAIQTLIMDKFFSNYFELFPHKNPEQSPVYKLQQRFLRDNIESMTVQTSQIAVCGSLGSVGWNGMSYQVGVSARPQRVTARAFVTALVIASGRVDRRHALLQPLMLGAEMEATWEAWRRAEGGPTSRHPTVSVSVEVGRVIAELRPTEVVILGHIQQSVQKILTYTQEQRQRSSSDTISNYNKTPSRSSLRAAFNATTNDADSNNHYYQDDLRSGAFKILSGGQLPMAYQIMLQGNTVSWRYPHPRAITRIVAFPLPGMDKETDCVLELFTQILGAWEPHTYFKIPVGEPRELQLNCQPPDAVFATTWRFRTCKPPEPTPEAYQFNAEKFMPKLNPLVTTVVEEQSSAAAGGVTAEQLSGVLRVDSYFAPQALPRINLVFRVADTEVHIHNALPSFNSHDTLMEGYYVARPLTRSHRVVSLYGHNSNLHLRLGAPSGMLVVGSTILSADIMDCATGTMEKLVFDFCLQAGLTTAALQGPRMRVVASPVQVSLHVTRLRTLHALAFDWNNVFEGYNYKPEPCLDDSVDDESRTSQDIVNDATRTLEGRVSLWVHNSCNSALRIGQAGTDEVVPLGPGVRLAYRWRCPTSPKRLRIAIADPAAHWHWSASLPFAAGMTRVRLEDPTTDEKDVFARGLGIYVHVKVDESGGKKYMHLCGRLILANMLRFRLLYKVRARTEASALWRTVCSDEMEAEHIGRSVLCAADAEMVLKVKFGNHESGWSGDIPLKECPKENVPWLVKVPSDGEMSYISVWCRVGRARSDGRIIATLWPLYVLHSHLPLDTDVLIVTEKNRLKPLIQQEDQPAPLVQSTPGRGRCTHLLAPGTTANKHNLSFQYRNIQCPVTREAVPLHYGVTDVSVFDKPSPVMHVEEVKQDIMNWLKRSSNQYASTWPYSLFSKHWEGLWQAALMQPRCDVTVRYQAIRAGGGCCLEVQLCPVVLLCNAAPLALTLRAHDAAPLCVLKPGTAIAPPSAILTKPFFISVEIGRETFVSQQLQVSNEDPGRYGQLPPGHLSLNHATHFSVLCNQKVALLTMYYEIKDEMNVFGITSSYVLINRLDINLQVSAIAIPTSHDDIRNLRVSSFKVVKPTKHGSIHGTSLCRFLLRGRWRGGHPSELQLFVCLALPPHKYATSSPVPVRLGDTAIRRAFALVNTNGISIPVTVTQVKHEHRCLIVVARDTCPQFVVQNLTRMPISVGQPTPEVQDQPSTSQVIMHEECPGVPWWCVVQPGMALHYSTPVYCARYPPPPPPAPPVTVPAVTLLAFGKLFEDSLRMNHKWSAPVAITGGEQLVQFHGDVTVKLCVTTHPHSTLIMLTDTNERDISASDIRRRLHGAVSSVNDLRTPAGANKTIDSMEPLQRIDAKSQLIEASNRLQNSSREGSLEKNKSQPSSPTVDVLEPTAVSSLSTATSSLERLKIKRAQDSELKCVQSSQDTETESVQPLQDTEGDSTQPSRDADLSFVNRPEDTELFSPQTESQNKLDLFLLETSTVRREGTRLMRSEEGRLEHASSLQPLMLEPTDSEAEIIGRHDHSLTKDITSVSTNLDIKDTRAELPSTVVFADPASGTGADMKCYRSVRSPKISMRSDMNLSRAELAFHTKPTEIEMGNENECLRCVVAGLVVKIAASACVPPLIAVHLDRSAVLVINDNKKTRAIVSVADVQIDNLQYETGQYDFAVVASTRPTPLEADPWPALWNMFIDKPTFSTKYREASLMVKLHVDKWTVVSQHHKEITELEIRLGSLALYVEDAYVKALLELSRLAMPSHLSSDTAPHISEERALHNPLRLRLLYIHPLNLTLTLHTAVRMYIALDQSPLRLSAFKLHDMMTSADRLTHALTVHYLSAAILGAGWVVGGLELLGAPGAIAARLGEATGGLKGVASATAAALLRSLSAWAGSLARNLDLLAGDEEHARRAAAARRRPPSNLLTGLLTGITNFAINILGAVGGLAHHPLVGVAVGESDSGTVALRRGLIGALTKPLSATADLVAYAGQGLLRQTGWDPILQPRSRWGRENCETAGWRRDCVRWFFRLGELNAISGFEVLLDNSPLQLLITDKYLVVADPETERIVEMIDLKFCSLAPYQGQIVELSVAHSRKPPLKMADGKASDEDDEYQISAAAMARVARYTGAEGAPPHAEARLLSLLTPPGRDHSLYAILATVLHQDPTTHLLIL